MNLRVFYLTRRGSSDGYFSDYFVIKGKGRNPFWGFLPLCYWCVVIVCTM